MTRQKKDTLRALTVEEQTWLERGVANVMGFCTLFKGKFAKAHELSHSLSYGGGGSGAKDIFTGGGGGGDAANTFTAKIDDITVFSANATQFDSYPTYTLVTVDASDFADGAAHTVTFSSATTGQVVNYNRDDVALRSEPPHYTNWIYLPLIVR